MLGLMNSRYRSLIVDAYGLRVGASRSEIRSAAEKKALQRAREQFMTRMEEVLADEAEQSSARQKELLELALQVVREDLLDDLLEG